MMKIKKKLLFECDNLNYFEWIWNNFLKVQGLFLKIKEKAENDSQMNIETSKNDSDILVW